MASSLLEHAVREVAADDPRAVELALEPRGEEPGAAADIEDAGAPRVRSASATASWTGR
jgi:hypothetical protein